MSRRHSTIHQTTIHHSTIHRSTDEWLCNEYLRTGSTRERSIWELLTVLGVWDVLAAYTPTVAGTIPLGIETDASDVDVLCEVPEGGHEAFAQLLTRHFGHHNEFLTRQMFWQGVATTVCNFSVNGGALGIIQAPMQAERIEIFGQSRPVGQQNGFRHLVVEARLLALAGEAAANAIRVMKRQGIKTEPAFAEYFGIAGDPYQALRDLYTTSDEELRQIVLLP